ncbi:MAG: class II fumarate hydratase [Bacteroidales bacterium]|nr:class II fumarate hydratase [Bacteroidales bacterium]
MQTIYRIEKDTLGNVEVSNKYYWGAQTQRSFQNFKIGNQRMPMEIIYSLALAKNAAAQANFELGVLDEEKKDLIVSICEEIIQGKLDEHFPLSVWQTGSGTQTNMNVNEVISNRAEMIKKGKIETDHKYLSANDDVNKSQSTNDMFPTAIRIAATTIIMGQTIPAICELMVTLDKKIEQFKNIKKIGRTHLMDATPLTLGDEFSGYRSQMEHCVMTLVNALTHLKELPIGGTAVGNGLNTPQGFDQLALHYIQKLSNIDFTNAPNKFEAMASHDSMVETSGALKRLAVSMMKIANDIRLLSSGPRCGIGEITIPANEPGSSIMPGKVNPTQCEAMTMVCCQVIGNDVAITTGGMQGQLDLNVFMPLIGFNLIQSAQLLADAINSFNIHCIAGIEPDLEVIQKHLKNSLMLVTKLNPHIGYYKAAEIAQYAHKNKLTLKEAAVELQILTVEKFDQLMK